MSGRIASAVLHGAKVSIEGGPAADHDPTGTHLRRYRPRSVLAVAGALFAVIFVIRCVTDPAGTSALLFTVPIALLAATLGARAGVLGGALGIALLALSIVHAHGHLTPLGWAARVTPLLLTGYLLGEAVDRLRRADAEHHHHVAELCRQREAIEINDTIVQGLSATKWSLEAGNADHALAIASETLELGHRLVSDLIREAGFSAAWTGQNPP